MPIGLGRNMPNDAITAFQFSITVDGYEIAQFSEITGITTEVDVIDFQENTASAESVLKKLPGKKKPPTIVLKHSKNMSIDMWTCGTRPCSTRSRPPPAKAAASSCMPTTAARWPDITSRTDGPRRSWSASSRPGPTTS